MNRPAVVLGYHRGGLALTRGLGRAGIPVFGVGAYRALADRSRYLRERHVAEWVTGVGAGDGLLEAIAGIAARHGRPVVFPDNDDGVEFLLDRWDDVRGLADLPLPDDADVVRRLRRKDLLPLEAAKAGIPSPATTLPESEGALLSSGLRGPVLVKPVEGKRFIRVFGCKAFVAADLAEAAGYWRQAHDEGLETIVQELVPDAVGSIWSLFAYIGRDGNVLAAVVGRKRRELPPSFGSSTVFDVRWWDRPYEVGAALLHSSGYRGFAHVELAHDRRDDSLQLIEVNTRVPVWASVAMGRRLNMASVAYDDLTGRPPARPAQLLRGPVAWIDLQEELERFVQVPVGPRALVAPYLSRRKARAIFAPDDPTPGLVAAARWAGDGAVRRPVHASRRWLRTRPVVQRLRGR